MKISPPCLLSLSLLLPVLPAAAGLRAPYKADAATVHLYHFSEEAGGSATANTGAAGGMAYPVDANPVPGLPVTDVLGAAGFTGFGNAAGFRGNLDYLIGYDANGNGAYQTDNSGAQLSPDAITMNRLGINASSPFTLEAMVQLTGVSANREIICTDSSAGTRGFQFRLNAGGSTGQRLEFNLIGVAGSQRFGEIPTTGPHAYALEEWFHAAVVFDGTVMRFYWTKVADSSLTANALGDPQDLTIVGGGTISGPLVFGNENRNVAAEGLNGLLDTVRISTVARSADQFIFFRDTENGVGDGLDDSWELTFFPDLSEVPGGDPDADGFTNLQEFNAGSSPADPVSTPLDVDADRLPDEYEIAQFGNATSQTGAGDPDGDYATNAEEFAADTMPLDRNSFPDSENGTGDGMGDAWEILYFGATTAQPGLDADADGFSNLEEFLANSNPLDPAWTPAKGKLRHRWTFNNILTDTVGASPAVFVDPDNDPATGGAATLSATTATLGGGARGTSSYIQLGTNLLRGLKTPVTLQLWATQNAVQNWSRIFDFGSGTSENLFMSWTQGANVNSDAVSWVDNVASTANNTGSPYTPATPFHIMMTIEPGAGMDSRTLVTWYARPVGTPDLGAPRGSFSTANSLATLNDAFNWLGRSQYTADNTANASFDEFRIWNGSLSAQEREAYHDAGPNVVNLNDADDDGLPDDWEVLNFGNTTAGNGPGDPDFDLYSNVEEYLANTDPKQIFSSPDTDADGLPDGWEVFWFRTASTEGLFDIIGKFAGADDPDGDSFTNRDEFVALTNPNVAALTPIDTDGDGLIDTWEMFHFPNFSENGAGNPDGDAGSNREEQAAGSNPTLASSTPADVDGNGIPDNTGVLKPYTADDSTLQLWHLDEVTPPALNAVATGPAMTSLANGALLWSPSLPGFRTGLNPSANRGTTASGLLSALPPANGNADNTIITLAGGDGAFTFEAIVRIDFDPAAPPNPATPMQIFSGEGDATFNRIFQFRIMPTAGAPVIQFVNVNAEVAVQTLAAPLPIGAGPDAILQGSWYHVAVTYNGAENTPENFRFYWTTLDASRSQANLLASDQMTNDLPVESPDFVIGNEGRSNAGLTDAFVGVIDEVRISSIARPATGFLFVPQGDSDGDGLADTWETTYFGGLQESAAGDFDRDGTSNLAEFRLGLLPDDGRSLFRATLTGAATLTWPSPAGLGFTIQRSVTLSGEWTNLATMTGTSGTTSYTDPNPPAGRAFYRVLLNN